MDREKALGFFLNLIQQKFNSNPNEAVVQTQLAKIANHKVESNGLNRMGAMEQFKIQFNPATFTLSQTQVPQQEFPELTLNWSRGTIEFINELAKTGRESANAKSAIEKQFNDANAKIQQLNAELAQKYAANKDALSAKIASLESTLADLTKTNELQATNIRDVLAENQTLIKQMSANDTRLKQMVVEATQKDSMNTQLKLENEQLDSQYKDLSKQLVQYTQLLDEHEKQMNDLNTQLSEEVSAKSTIQRELETKKLVESDNIELKDILSKRDAELQKMHGEIDSIRNSSKDVENQYRMEKTKMQIVFEAQKSLMEKQQEYKIQQITDEITQNSSSSNADLVKQIQELKADFEKEKAALAEATQRAEVLKQTNKQCEEEKDGLDQTNKRCEEEKSSLDQENQQCESDKNLLKQTIEENNKKILEIEKQIALLKMNNTQLKQTNAEQSLNHAKKLFKLEGEMEQLQIENNELYKRLDELQDELGTLKETYEKATQDLKTAHETEREKLILKQTEEIAKSADREKQVNMKYEIDACLINNSIASLGWNNWENAKTYFLDRYKNVNEIEGLKEITGLQLQIDAISKSETLDDLIQSFGMFTISSSSISSVEPDCMKNLVDLIIKFLRSQKEIEDLKKETENTRVEAEKIRTEVDLAKQKHDLMVQQNDEIVLKLTALEDKIQTTQGQNMDLSTEKAELQQQINDLKKQMIDQNNVLTADQKDQMKALLETVETANVTNEQLKSELDQIKDELESSEYHKILSIRTNNLVETQKQQLEADLKTHLAEIQKLKLEMDALQNTAEKQSAENHRAKLNNQQLAQHLTKAANDNKVLSEQLELEQTQYEEMVNKATTEIEDLEKQYNDNKEELDSTQSVLEAKKQELAETQGNLTQITNQLSQLIQTHEQIKRDLEALKVANETQKQEHAQAIQRAKDEYETQRALIEAQKTTETDLKKLIAEKAQLESRLQEAITKNLKCDRDLNAILQQLPVKDDLIQKLQQKLSNIYKQQIIDRANYTLHTMNYKAPTYVAPQITSSGQSGQYININKNNRAGKKILDLFGGSGLTMKGGTIINFSYDDEDDPIDTNDIKFLTNEENEKIINGIIKLKDQIADLEKTSSSNLKLLIQKLLITKVAHAQNFKALLFEKIANGINKQIIAEQAPAIERLRDQIDRDTDAMKTGTKNIEDLNKTITENEKQIEDLNETITENDRRIEELETKIKDHEKEATNKTNISEKLNKALKTANLNLKNSSAMFKDNNVFYYKTRPIP